MLSIEDLKDCDPDIWGDIVKDAVRSVNKKSRFENISCIR